MMFKQIATLLRGRAHEAVEAVAARNAMTILDQQMREAGFAIQRGQHALAAAIAEDQRDARQICAIEAQIAGLEARMRAAWEGGAEALARKAAGTIAQLEMDRDAGHQARAAFAGRISRLRAQLDDAQARLAALHRGRRVARLTEAARIAGRAGAPGSLAAAEDTLAGLRLRHEAEAAADEMFTEIAAPGAIEDRLGAAGFGAASRPTPEGVLARLGFTQTNLITQGENT
jgi:phage shock protein A